MIHDTKPPLDDDLLIHYGVSGMKWGVRRNTPDASGVTRKQARQQIRTQNRQTRRNLEDFEVARNRSDLIRTSRGNKTAMKRYYEDSKSDVKARKASGKLGRNKARVIMNRLRNERYENIYRAESKTAGEQFVEALFTPRPTATA